MKRVSKMTSRLEADQFNEKKWLAIRRKAGRKINPATAEVTCRHGQILDPYGVVEFLPKEHYQYGRNYFARSPRIDMWVWFGDLPESTQDALWKKHS